jgi:hypothetical protein
VKNSCRTRRRASRFREGPKHENAKLVGEELGDLRVGVADDPTDLLVDQPLGLQRCLGGVGQQIAAAASLGGPEPVDPLGFGRELRPSRASQGAEVLRPIVAELCLRYAEVVNVRIFCVVFASFFLSWCPP